MKKFFFKTLGFLGGLAIGAIAIWFGKDFFIEQYNNIKNKVTDKK